jgi:hypothetical protein
MMRTEQNHMKLLISMVKSNDRKLYGLYRQIKHNYLIIENALQFEKKLLQP